jgi:hypothetical protein
VSASWTLLRNGDLRRLSHCIISYLYSNTWAKSLAKSATERCEAIVNRMEDLYSKGRTELGPDTASYNTVLDAISRSNQPGFERRAESLLEHMDEMCSRDEVLRKTCQPDQYSFNTVVSL